MKNIKIVLIAFGVLLGFSSKAQCGYDTTSVNITHILCNGGIQDQLICLFRQIVIKILVG